MKRLVMFAALALAGCGDEAKAPAGPKDAYMVAKGLGFAGGLPVENIKVVTASDDANKLMGRPGQYTSKVFFFDARHPKTEAGGDEGENSVEMFDNETDAAKRRDYVDGITRSVPMFAEYSYLKGRVYLRLSKVLTPEEAKQYEAALQKMYLN